MRRHRRSFGSRLRSFMKSLGHRPHHHRHNLNDLIHPAGGEEHVEKISAPVEGNSPLFQEGKKEEVKHHHHHSTHRHHHSRDSWLRRLFKQRSHRRHRHHHHRQRHWFFRRRKISGEVTFPLVSGTGLANKTSQEAATTQEIKTKKAKEFYRELTRFGNSMAIFMVTYLIAWFTYQFAVMFTASFFNIYSVLTYYEVLFPVGNDSPLWTPMNIIVITSSGPFISLIAGFIYFIILKRRRNMGPQKKLFFIWLCLNSLAHFFGAFVAGAITWQGFGFVIAWLFMRFIFRLIISLLFLSILGYIGRLLFPEILSTAIIPRQKKEIPWFLFTRIILPWFIGSGLLILLKIPNIIPQHVNILDYDIIILSSLVFAVVPSIFFPKVKRQVQHSGKRHRSRRNLIVMIWFISTVCVFLLYRIGLSGGLYIYMKFAFGITSYR